MLNFSNTKIESMVIHQVGNKSREQGVKHSGSAISIADDMHRELLMQYFTKPFNGDVAFSFAHAADIRLNEMYCYAHNIFNHVDANPEVFYSQSVEMANHLYDQSTHPRIKSGELYAVMFRDVLVDDELCDAIGVFKSENKDNYMHLNKDMSLDFTQGINLNKPDRGCIILNTEADHGYKVYVTASLDDKPESTFWKDEFLRVEARPDEFYMTKRIIDMVEKFSVDCLSRENDVDKREQVDFRAKAAKYFDDRDTFVMEEFEKEVLKGPEIIETFREYGESYREAYHMPDSPVDFTIDHAAKKDAVKKFKSVIKLDNNFHIYVHANPDMMEKGYDETKKKSFYKVYFTEEK